MLAGGADGGGILGVGAARGEKEGGGEVRDVEFKLRVFVIWVERGGDSALICGCEKGDGELKRRSR